MKTIFVVFFILWSAETAYATSETILKAGADVKYRQLIQCVKGNNNDISNCTNQFIQYLKAEKKLLSGTVNKQQYQRRLIKMISYFKKSTDIFIDKARQTSDLKTWKKAAACSSVLVRLSNKYSDKYRKIEQEYQLCKKGASVSVGLAALLRKMKMIEEPDYGYVQMLKKFTNATIKGYSILPPNLQKEATTYAQQQVDGFIKKMEFYNNSLKNREKTSLVSANAWQETYDLVRNFPGVSAKEEAARRQSDFFCGQLDDYATQLDEIEKTVLSGYQLVKNKRNMPKLAQLATETSTHYELVKYILLHADNANKICPNSPVLDVVRYEKIENALSFQAFFAEAAIQEESGNLIAAARGYENALQLSSIPNDLKETCKMLRKKINSKLYKNMEESVNEALQQKKGVNEILSITDEMRDAMQYDPKFTSRVRLFQRETLLRMGKEFRKEKRKIQTIQDAQVAYMPVYDKTYLMNPPLDGPKDKKQYYAWPCKIDQKYGSGYLCQDTSWILKGGELEAFFLRDVKAKYTELLSGRMVTVVGRYVHNKDVSMVLGNTRQIPVLDDCYIFPSIIEGYSIDKIEEILSRKK